MPEEPDKLKPGPGEFFFKMHARKKIFASAMPDKEDYLLFSFGLSGISSRIRPLDGPQRTESSRRNPTNVHSKAGNFVLLPSKMFSDGWWVRDPSRGLGGHEARPYIGFWL